MSVIKVRYYNRGLLVVCSDINTNQAITRVRIYHKHPHSDALMFITSQHSRNGRKPSTLLAEMKSHVRSHMRNVAIFRAKRALGLIDEL